MTRFLTKSICWISCLILLINPDHVISQTTITLQPDSLEGKDATVYFSKYIRQEIEFKGVDELKSQLVKDKMMVEELIY